MIEDDYRCVDCDRPLTEEEEDEGICEQDHATGPQHFRCPDCGPHVAADEDGCCATCGADCVGEPCGGHVCGTELAAAHDEIARLREAWRKGDD